MTASTEPVKVSDIPTDDSELIEELAKLQHMHQQIHELRRLLPTGLLSPARDAISQPRRANPKQVAFKISKAAQKGRQDIQAFKKEWHDEKMKQLFKEANVAEISQGIDAWLVDYQKLAISGTKTTTSQSQDEDAPFDTIDKARKDLNDFEESEHGLNLQYEKIDPDPFPINLEVARLRFKIQRGEENYQIESDSKDNLAQQIAEQINHIGNYKDLRKLLNHVEAYNDIRQHKCDSCKSLIDSNFDLPLLRKSESGPSSDGQSPKWLVLHKSCAT